MYMNHCYQLIAVVSGNNRRSTGLLLDSYLRLHLLLIIIISYIKLYSDSFISWFTSFTSFTSFIFYYGWIISYNIIINLMQFLFSNFTFLLIFT